MKAEDVVDLVAKPRDASHLRRERHFQAVDFKKGTAARWL